MEEKGILHIKLFEYLIEKDGSFDYVEIRCFLLANFEEMNDAAERLKMKRFLDFLISENYIEKMVGHLENGISISHSNGIVPRNKISSVIRIKPKAVELYNSYIYNKNNLSSVKKTIIISSFAILVSVVSIFYPRNKETKTTELLLKKYDSISTIYSNLKDENYHLRLKEQQLKQKEQ